MSVSVSRMCMSVSVSMSECACVCLVCVYAQNGPMAIMKYQNDPEVRLFLLLPSCMYNTWCAHGVHSTFVHMCRVRVCMCVSPGNM
jgi:hypothetical protein